MAICVKEFLYFMKAKKLRTIQTCLNCYYSHEIKFIGRLPKISFKLKSNIWAFIPCLRAQTILTLPIYISYPFKSRQDTKNLKETKSVRRNWHLQNTHFLSWNFHLFGIKISFLVKNKWWIENEVNLTFLCLQKEKVKFFIAFI